MTLLERQVIIILSSFLNPLPVSDVAVSYLKWQEILTPEILAEAFQCDLCVGSANYLFPCGHMFCTSCLDEKYEAIFQSSINGGVDWINGMTLQCPVEDCPQSATFESITTLKTPPGTGGRLHPICVDDTRFLYCHDI